jgi:signal transduction histidine kinase
MAERAGSRSHWRRRISHWAQGPRVNGPLRRRKDGRVMAGVAAGVAARTGFELSAVRVAFVAIALASGGVAVVGYVLAWLFVPSEAESGTIAGKAAADGRGITLSAGIGSLLLALLLVASDAGAGWVGAIAWPLVLSVVGLILIWRNGTQEDQEVLRRLTSPLHGLTEGTAGSRLARGLAALLLLGAGLGLLLTGHPARALLLPFGGAMLLVAGFGLALGPWWGRIARDLVAERQARVRAEERADMAARVHDSVLQTLALIQRRADDPQQIVRLARAQERELRSWLFDGRAPGSLDSENLTFGSGVRVIEQDVELQHGIAVDAIIVGDCELDDDLQALLAAAREATVNAAKWSGAPVVSIFAEVEPAAVSVYVRDRGRGFDPAAVPADRMGLAESVRGRMTRRGGTAVIRSAAGEGTEVSLTMPRVDQAEPSRT